LELTKTFSAHRLNKIPHHFTTQALPGDSQQKKDVSQPGLKRAVFELKLEWQHACTLDHRDRHLERHFGDLEFV